MKLPPFDARNKRWDAYKRFHATVPGAGPFIQFEDGALLLAETNRRGGWGHGGVNLEANYETLGVTLFSGYNPAYERRNGFMPATIETPEGEKIFDNWLTRVHQLRLWDRETGRIVAADQFASLDYPSRYPEDGGEGPAKRGLGGYVCFPHEGALPIPGGKTFLSRPGFMDKRVRKERRELSKLCLLWARLGDKLAEYEEMNYRDSHGVRSQRRRLPGIVRNAGRDNDEGRDADQIFSTMTDAQRLCIALFGLPNNKETVQYDYLVSKP